MQFSYDVIFASFFFFALALSSAVLATPTLSTVLSHAVIPDHLSFSHRPVYPFSILSGGGAHLNCRSVDYSVSASVCIEANK